MERKEPDRGSTYRIRLKGALGRPAVEWFGDVAILPEEDGDTLLVGRFADQPALRGFLDQLWNLNFTVLSVVDLEAERGGEEDIQ